MTFQVRLYLHHDNDLIQLHLNGIRLSDIFAKSLEAHYKKEELSFEMPKQMELKPHKGRIYRIKVTLDEAKKPDLVQWVCAFPEQYKCHCIKNIARTYLGSAVIDALNGMAQAGTWVPGGDQGNSTGQGKAVRLREWKKKDGSQGDAQWIDQVSATREKTEEQKRKIEEGRKKIRNKSIEEILGTRPSDIVKGTAGNRPYRTAAGTAMTAEATAPEPVGVETLVDNGDGGDSLYGSPYAGSAPGASPMDAWRDIVVGSGDTGAMDGQEDPEDAGDIDDFDVSLHFEKMRAQ